MKTAVILFVLALIPALFEHSEAEAKAKSYIVVDCRTKTKHIQVEQNPNLEFRFTQWKRADSPAAKPEIQIRGDVKVIGSAGNILYSFKNESAVYTLSDENVCSEEPQYWDAKRKICKIILSTTKNGGTPVEEECHETVRRRPKPS